MERKKEGASDSELKLYDSEVISNTLSTKNTTLLEYRIMRAKEGASKDELANMDTHIFKEFGTTPIRLGNIKVRNFKEDFYVAVDLNRETVADLVKKIALHIGVSIGMVKVIFKGKHLDEYYTNQTLFSIQLEKDSEVGICFRLGCDGRGCCDVGYNMLCDMLLKKSESVFNTLSEDTRKNVLYTLVELDILDKLYKKIDNIKAENEKVLEQSQEVLKQSQEVLKQNKKQSEINDKLYNFLKTEAKLSSNSREALSFIDFDSKASVTWKVDDDKLFKQSSRIDSMKAILLKACLEKPLEACLAKPLEACLAKPLEAYVEPLKACLAKPLEANKQSETLPSEPAVVLDEDLYG